MRDAPVFDGGCEPLISRQDPSPHYRVGCSARSSALPRERFSPLAQSGRLHNDGFGMSALYGPTVRCKPNVKKWRGLVLRICIRPLHGAFVLLAIMDIRAPPISFSESPERPLGSPDHGYDGETVSPSPQFNSQTSAGIAVHSSVASGISLGHSLGEPERVDLMRPLARRALRSCDLVPTQSKRSAPAYWRVRLPGRYGVSVVPQP
jgi:hypothetical protein